jgi:hypothetical protein
MKRRNADLQFEMQRDRDRHAALETQKDAKIRPLEQRIAELGGGRPTRARLEGCRGKEESLALYATPHPQPPSPGLPARPPAPGAAFTRS